jgi:hypothetical protein
MSGSKTLAISLMAGPETPDLAEAAAAGGADLLEIGFPFSDSPAGCEPAPASTAWPRSGDGSTCRSCR